MTREEAIQRLKANRDAMYFPETVKALDMAIEALKDRHKGEWVDIDNYYRLATCSHCHKVTMFEKWGEYTKPYNFCPNCGARMKGGDDE